MRVGRHDSFHDEVCYKASELDQAHHSFSGRDETCPHASQRWWTSGGSPDCPTIRVRGLPHLEQTASARVTRKTCSHASHRCQTEPAPTLRVWSLPHFGHMCAMDSPTNTARVVPLLTGRIRCWQFAAHLAWSVSGHTLTKMTRLGWTISAATQRLWNESSRPTVGRAVGFS